jgi:3-isopropylmalate dehydratase small subunit
VRAIVAKSFARIFYRAAINQGLLLIECPDAVDNYKDGDEVKLDAEAGSIEVGGKKYSFPKLPSEILAIRDAGGLLAYTVNILRQTKSGG